MFRILGRSITRRPWLFLASWLVLLAAAGGGALTGYGHDPLFDRLATAEADVPGAQSSDVLKLTATAADQGPVITVVVRNVDVKSDPVRAAQAVAASRQKLQVSHVESVTDAFTLPSLAAPQAQALLSTNGDGFVVLVTLQAGLSSEADKQTNIDVEQAVPAFQDSLRNWFPNADAYVVSPHSISDAITGVVESDLVRGESIGLPVALVIMMVVFGGFLAAGLPLVGALSSIGMALGIMWALTFVTDVNTFIVNVISIIGVALSIDYGLLMVSRYREELIVGLANVGLPTDGHTLPGRNLTRTIVIRAVQRTVSSAGRTVTFSAVTIAFSVAGLLTIRVPLLRSIALGAVVVTLLAVLSAITLVPAIITLLGRRLVKPSLMMRTPGLRRVSRTVGDISSDTGAFSRLAHRVHRHPWPVLVAVVALLAVMASPIRSLTLRSNIAEYIPTDSATSVGYQTLQDDYPALATPSVLLIAKTAPSNTTALVSHIKQLPKVSFVQVQELASHPGWTRIGITVDTADQVGKDVLDVVHNLRGIDMGYPILVGGAAALQLDFTDTMIRDAPLALVVIVLAVTVLLFLMTGSLVVPLKALVINSLSLVASLGATTWLFQGGHLGLTKVNGLETFIIAIMAAFGFGLAMDYEVFLLARIKEYYDAGYSNDEAVERGLQRSGRIITSAAAIIVAVFVGFASGQMIAIREIGVGLALMVATDASLVRLLLVPSTMTLLGQWNWWAPRWLRGLYNRLGIEQ